MSIHPMHMAFYSESLRFHCQSALNSSHIVSEVLKTPEARSNQISQIENGDYLILDNLQSFLINAAAISRYLWPSSPGSNSIHEIRADSLRTLYGIDDSSALKSRALRNRLEHFDENLDKYLKNEPIVGIVIPNYVGIRPSEDDVPSHIFRAYFIDDGVFRVLGKEYEVQPLVSEIHRLIKKIVR